MRRMEGPRSDTMTSSRAAVRDAESEDSGDVTKFGDDRTFTIRLDGAASTASRDMEGSLQPVGAARCCVVARQELVRTALRPIIDAGHAGILPRTGGTL